MCLGPLVETPPPATQGHPGQQEQRCPLRCHAASVGCLPRVPRAWRATCRRSWTGEGGGVMVTSWMAVAAAPPPRQGDLESSPASEQGRLPVLPDWPLLQPQFCFQNGAIKRTRGTLAGRRPAAFARPLHCSEEAQWAKKGMRSFRFGANSPSAWNAWPQP